MATYHREIDAYIQKSAAFAQPILEHLRGLVHEACPTITEAIKWNFPNFDYNGSILCSMGAFKHYCHFGFWLGDLLSDPNGLIIPIGEKSGMGGFGKIKTLADLPADKILIAYCKEAMGLVDMGIKLPKKLAANAKPLEIPVYLLEALSQNMAAKTTFENFSLSNKKDYVLWMEEAKTEATLAKRLAQGIELMAEGKSRNWKYEKKHRSENLS